MMTRCCWSMWILVALALFSLQGPLPCLAQETYPPPKTLGPTEQYGRAIQRTMRKLAESTPTQRNTVKILFYGQSITEQTWSKQVADDLRQRFPHADLVIENRAIGGFASQLLVKTAETDLYPFYPDLVIFHVYGSHIEYENILRRIRQRTTAEILMQTDHLSARDQLDEETDGQKLTPASWSQWFNYVFLPGMARKYGAELVDQRNLWKQYLRDHQLQPSDLLRDGVHLNDHGCYVMAEIVKAYLRFDPALPAPEPAKADQIRTLEIGKDLHWQDGKLVVEFTGNRVDVIAAPATSPAAPAEVWIDGRRPAEFPELYTLSRTTAYPGSKWPCVLLVGREQPWQAEEWTLTLSDIAPEMKEFRFQLSGSKTGPDGSGKRSERFVSNSGRVVIDPADWNFDYALKVFKKPVAEGFQIRWQVRPMFVDPLSVPAVSDSTRETVVTLAQGLPHGKHRLEIRSPAPLPLSAVRIYCPPGE